MTTRPFLDAVSVRALVTSADLVDPIREAFIAGIESPPRQKYRIAAEAGVDLLLMPAWRDGGLVGVKVIMVAPMQRPSVDGGYHVFDAQSGTLLALIDARVLTELRTAAVSLLGKRVMSPAPKQRILVLGAGAIALSAAVAHCRDEPNAAVFIWNRTPSRAEALCAELARQGISGTIVEDLDAQAREADLICSAAAASQPLLRGDVLQRDAHLSLLGAYQPHMREVESSAFAKANVAIDVAEALTCGDLLAARAAGHLSGSPATLRCLVTSTQNQSLNVPTIFKSVGAAIADLATAETILKRACLIK
jgi:ornithine cyclodeaminase